MNNLYAGFWIRTLAHSIDKIILYFIYIIFYSIGASCLDIDNLSSGSVAKYIMENNAFSLWLLSFFIDMAYYTYFHGLNGQTPGKMLFAIRIIQTSGDKLTFGLAFLRWAGYLFSGLIIGLGYFWIALDREKQGWHDKIAGTVVIHKGEYQQQLPYAS